MAASFTHGCVSVGRGEEGREWRVLAGRASGEEAPTMQAAHPRKVDLAKASPLSQALPGHRYEHSNTKTQGEGVQRIMFLQTAGSRGFKT